MPEETPPKETKIGRAATVHQLPVSPMAEARDTLDKVERFHRQQTDAIEAALEPRLSAAVKEWEDFEFRYGELQAALNRQPQYWHEPASWFHLLALIVLALALAPINRVGLDLLFIGDHAVTALALSVVMGSVLVAFAHWFGLTWRRYRTQSEDLLGAIATTATLVVLGALLLALSYGVALYRQGYFDFATRPASFESELVAPFASGAVFAIRDTLDSSGMTYMAVNVSIIAVAGFLSYFRYDPHPAFEQLDRRRRRAQARYQKYQARRGDALAAEERRYAADARRQQSRQ
jgi:hypothetical protein